MSYVGPGCSAIGCRKRKRGNKCPNYTRSDSEGDSDEESETKRTLPRTFHVFPSNPVKRRRWIDSMGRENFTPGSGTLICSDHFKEIDMDRTGQTVRVRQDAIPTRFKKDPKHREKKVKGKVRKKEPDVAVSRCKRNIKVKRRDDEIIEWGPKCRRVLVKKVTKQPMNRSEKKKNTTQKEKKKRTIKVQLTKGSDGVKRMRKHRIKIENNKGYHSLANSSDDLPMDSVNIKEELISDECIELSEEEIDDTPSAQDLSPVKKTPVSVKTRRDPISNGVSKKLASTLVQIIDWKFYAQLLDNGRQTQQETINLLEPDHVEFCHLRRIVRRCRPSFNGMVTRLFELAEDMQLKEFTDCEATANFMADVYRAFDIVNSRNPVTTGEKPPITSLFMGEQLETTTVISRRIYGLEVHPGSRVIDEGRWMSVMLFPFILKSVSIMASNLLNGDCLKYFTTYRLNLDHSDMILSNIQRCGGWDGIPTASEFRQGYKELFESVIKSKMSVYCSDFDGDDLTVGQGVICPFRRNLPIPAHDDIDFLSRSYCLVDLNMDVAVKATCVIRQISQRLSCMECMALMVDGDYVMDSKKIINLDYIMPSKFITKLLQISERILKIKLLESSQVNFEHTVISIFTECFISLGNLNDVLSVPSDHVKEEPHHVIGLIKAVIRTIISYRLNSTKYLSVVKSKLLKDFR